MNALQFAKTLFHSQFFVTPPLPTSSFADQTIIVTGSNSGVGYETVKHLVRLDAKKIILAVRDAIRGENAGQRIVKETGCAPDRLEVWPFDLADFESIRAFVKRADGLDRLDAVMQNAGIYPPKTWTADKEGTEITVKVNTLGPIYFAYAILPKLKASAEKTGLMGRLSLNGSDIMFLSTFTKQNLPGALIDALNDPKQSKFFGDRYATSKTLLFYAIHRLASQSPLAPGSNVLINVMTPGATKSDLFAKHEKAWYEVILTALIRSIARETDVGARTLVHAVEPNLSAEAHGQFLMNSSIMKNNPMFTIDNIESFQSKWEKELISLLEKVQAGVTTL